MSFGPKSLQKTVASAGTAEALTSTPTYASFVVVKGLGANGADVYIGDSNVSSSNGYVLDAGEEIVLQKGVVNGTDRLVDLSKIYIDVDTNAEGVSVFYFEES